MTYLSLDDLLMLDAMVINHSGGALQIREIGRLESSIASQRQEAFDEIIYKSIYDKAAAICRGLICDHPFVDSNKRTTMLASITLLELNGLKFEATNKQLEDYAVHVARNRPNVDEISDWLKTNTVTL